MNSFKKERVYNMGRAYIEMEAIIPIAVKPNIASIGGFSVTDKKTDKSIIFDWCSYSGSFDIGDDPNNPEPLKLNFELREFDYDFFEESNEDSSCKSFISDKRLQELIELDNNDSLEEFLTSCEIEEVHYECFIGVDEEIRIPLKVTSFQISDYEFSKEQIEKYNASIYEKEKRDFIKDIEDYFKEYESKN